MLKKLNLFKSRIWHVLWPSHECDLTGPIAIIMGAEDTGLRPITQAQCDYKVYIPMQGNLQSLNVSVATGMALYEACRQRQG